LFTVEILQVDRVDCHGVSAVVAAARAGELQVHSTRIQYSISLEVVVGVKGLPHKVKIRLEIDVSKL
jgi:hypothetical protein